MDNGVGNGEIVIRGFERINIFISRMFEIFTFVEISLKFIQISALELNSGNIKLLEFTYPAADFCFSKKKIFFLRMETVIRIKNCIIVIRETEFPPNIFSKYAII